MIDSQYFLVKKKFGLSLDMPRIFKFLLVGIGIFGLVFVLSEEFLEYNNDVFEFIPSVLCFVLLGIVGYLVLTYAVDSRTRKLFKAVIDEVKK